MDQIIIFIYLPSSDVMLTLAGCLALRPYWLLLDGHIPLMLAKGPKHGIGLQDQCLRFNVDIKLCEP